MSTIDHIIEQLTVIHLALTTQCETQPTKLELEEGKKNVARAIVDLRAHRESVTPVWYSMKCCGCGYRWKSLMMGTCPICGHSKTRTCSPMDDARKDGV